MAWPPITMATQHPDNASSPWWKDGPFVSTQDEIEELLLLFRELPVDEYMWDWEGKYVDESVGEKLFSRARDFFRTHPLGEDFHLTYRVPAYADGKMHRLARAFMNVLSLADLGKDIGLPRPPVTEMFLPLTTAAEQPLSVRKAFREVADYHRAVFHQSKEREDAMLRAFEVTPLVEDVDSLLAIDRIVEPYWQSLLAERGKDALRKRGQRVFLARSDPALNAGLVPAVLAVRVALSVTARLGEKLGFPVHPVIGTGSLPFRGSVNPELSRSVLDQYAGTRTYSIQSAFRYDYPKADVIRALKMLKKEIPKRKAPRMSIKTIAEISELAGLFQDIWKPTVEAMADLINATAAYVPQRRERLQHIGLFGYSRGVGAVRLPRAIGFTAALYSLGIPPELIATGRGLLQAKKRKLLPLLEEHYPALRQDLETAGLYLNRENIDILSRRYPIFRQIRSDISAMESVLKITLGPREPNHIIHRNLTSTILHRVQGEADAEVITQDIVQAAVLRRSLG